MTFKHKNKIVVNSIKNTDIIFFICYQISCSSGVIYNGTPHQIYFFNKLKLIIKNCEDFKAGEESYCDMKAKRVNVNINEYLFVILTLHEFEISIVWFGITGPNPGFSLGKGYE